MSRDEAERNQRENQEVKNINKLSMTDKENTKCKQTTGIKSCSLDNNFYDDLNENDDSPIAANKDSFLLSLVRAGARDLGGISPIDEVNPTYHFQKINHLKTQLQFGNFKLVERLPVYERHYTLLSERVRNVVNEKYSNFYA